VGRPARAEPSVASSRRAIQPVGEAREPHNGYGLLDCCCIDRALPGCGADDLPLPDGRWSLAGPGVRRHRLIRQYKANEWQFVSSENVPVPVRKTPLWAIILGLLLFFTLIGILFFFVKETKTEMRPGITIATADGQFSGVIATGSPPPPLAATRKE
jgi:hypothetical protein